MTGARMDETDLELQRKAIESLIKDAALWKKKRDRAVRATRLTQFSLNKNFLKNLLTRNESFNERLKNAKKSKHKALQNEDLSDNEASTSGRRKVSESSHAESEDTSIIVNKKHKKRRHLSSSESSSSDSSISTTSDSSIEVIIAKKQKRRKRRKSSKHSRKRRSSSSLSYETLRKHIEKSVSSKYLKLPSQSNSKIIKKNKKREKSGDKDVSDILFPSESTKKVSRNHNRLFKSNESLGFKDETRFREPNVKENSSVQMTCSQHDRENMKCSIKTSTMREEGISHKVNKHSVIENIEQIHPTIILEENASISQVKLKNNNKDIHNEETKSKGKEFIDEMSLDIKKRKSHHKSYKKEKLLEKREKLEVDCRNEHKLCKEVILYSDEDDIFLKIAPLREKEKTSHKRLGNELCEDDHNVSLDMNKDIPNSEYSEMEKRKKILYDNDSKCTNSGINVSLQDGVKSNKIPTYEVNVCEKESQEEASTQNKTHESIGGSIELLSSKVSFSLASKQVKTVNKPKEFQQPDLELSDISDKYRSASPSLSRHKSKKSKKKNKKEKSKDVKVVKPKVDVMKRRSCSDSCRSYSTRDHSSRSRSRRRSSSRSISKYSRRGTRTPSSDSYCYSRSSRSKYRSFSRSKTRSDKSYRRNSRSSRDSRSYSSDSRRKYGSYRHSSYSPRNRHSSGSSYRDSSRYKSRKYRDQSSSSRSRRRRSISFSYVYTNPEKARKYYRRSISSSSSNSDRCHKKYNGK